MQQPRMASLCVVTNNSVSVAVGFASTQTDRSRMGNRNPLQGQNFISLVYSKRHTSTPSTYAVFYTFLSRKAMFTVQIYKRQAVDMGYDECHLFMRSIQFEFAKHNDKAGKPPPIFITAIQEDDSTVDRFNMKPTVLLRLLQCVLQYIFVFA